MRATLSAASLALIVTVALPASASAADTRLIGQPLASIGRDDNGAPFFVTYARTSRPVARKASGTLLGAMRLDGLGAPAVPDQSAVSSNGFRAIATRGKRYCYAQSFSVFGLEEYPASLRKSRVGQRVRVEFLMAGVSEPLTARTTLRTRADLTERRAIRKLGCLGPARKSPSTR